MNNSQDKPDVYTNINHDKSPAGKQIRLQFSFTLTRLRHQLNLSLDRAACLSGLTEEQIADIEQAGTNVSFEHWIDLLEKYSAME